jgi:hypothetical protein
MTKYYGISSNEEAELLPYLTECIPDYVRKIEDSYYLVAPGIDTEESVDYTLGALNGISKVKYGCIGLSRLYLVSPINPSTKTYADFEQEDKQHPAFAEMLEMSSKSRELTEALIFFARSGEDHERELFNLDDTYHGILRGIGHRQLSKWASKLNIHLFEQWVNNAYLSGNRAVHSIAFSDEKAAKAIIEITGYIETSPIDFSDIFKKWTLKMMGAI